MNNAEIAQKKTTDFEVLNAHWADCMEDELPGHSKEAHGAVNTALARFYEALQELPDEASQKDILEQIKMLFATLDEINTSSNNCLLETDERELIVPFVINAARLAGLRTEMFEYNDPTFQFRNF